MCIAIVCFAGCDVKKIEINIIFLIKLNFFLHERKVKQKVKYPENEKRIYPVGIYLLKVNNRNTRTRCEICSKLTSVVKRRSGVFIVNSEHISHLVLVFLLLTLSWVR